MATQVQHHLSSLKADVKGVLDEDVVLFRGLPYANVEKRWTHSRTIHTLESPFDATEYGPRCSQGEGQVLVTGGQNNPIPVDDEFHCLNLNIAVPQAVLKTESKLPVMVWIHGYVK
jgi:carboxylesterase type B